MVREPTAGHKILGLSILLVGMSLVGTRILFQNIDEKLDFQVNWISQRMRLAIQNFPQIVSSPGQRIVFIGRSDIENGFAPESLDHELRNLGTEATSYNLGFRDLGPMITDQLVLRLSLEVQKQARPLELVMIQFSPTELTEKYLSHSYQERENMTLKNIVFPDASWTHTAENWIFAGRSPFAFSQLIIKNIFPDGSPLVGTFNQHERELKAISRAFWNDPALYVESPWDEKTRGYFNWSRPQSELAYKEHMEQLKAREFLKLSWDSYVDCCDAGEMHIAPGALNGFIQTVQALKKIAKTVVIVYKGENPAIRNHSNEALQRLSNALSKLHAETGVKILDYSQSEWLEADDFFDFTHLTEVGKAKFNQHLAGDIAPFLRQEPK